MGSFICRKCKRFLHTPTCRALVRHRAHIHAIHSIAYSSSPPVHPPCHSQSHTLTSPTYHMTYPQLVPLLTLYYLLAEYSLSNSHYPAPRTRPRRPEDPLHPHRRPCERAAARLVVQGRFSAGDMRVRICLVRTRHLTREHGGWAGHCSTARRCCRHKTPRHNHLYTKSLQHRPIDPAKPQK